MNSADYTQQILMAYIDSELLKKLKINSIPSGSDNQRKLLREGLDWTAYQYDPPDNNILKVSELENGLEPGELVYWLQKSKSDPYGHVAIYFGFGLFLDNSSNNNGVGLIAVQDYDDLVNKFIVTTIPTR